jgi:hypothetical protein
MPSKAVDDSGELQLPLPPSGTLPSMRSRKQPLSFVIYTNCDTTPLGLAFNRRAV